MYRKSKYIGSVKNNLLVIDSKRKNKSTVFICTCLICGTIQERPNHGFVNGESKCIKCHPIKSNHKGKKTVNDDIYRLYSTIIQRCKRPAYKSKNIIMCKEWFDDFEKFRTWAKEHGFKKGLTIDRIDYNGIYEPLNCRFVDRVGQANNRSSNLIVEYNGEKDTVANLCRKHNKNRVLIYGRLKAGWTVKDAFEKPIDTKKWSKSYAKNGN